MVRRKCAELTQAKEHVIFRENLKREEYRTMRQLVDDRIGPPATETISATSEEEGRQHVDSTLSSLRVKF